MPLITIITPTVWRPDFLRKCILAVKKQTIQDYEHFIFSDHCPFAKFIIDEFKDDKRITFYENEEPKLKSNKKLARGSIGRKKGIELAKSDIICYCDDDNIVLPNHLETIINNLQNKDIDIVFTSRYVINLFKDFEKKKNFGLGPCYKSYFEWLNRSLDDYSGYYKISCGLDTGSIGHRKNIVEKFSCTWNPNYHPTDDHALINAWKNNGAKVLELEDITYIYFAHKGIYTSVPQYKKEYERFIEKKYFGTTEMSDKRAQIEPKKLTQSGYQY